MLWLILCNMYYQIVALHAVFWNDCMDYISELGSQVCSVAGCVQVLAKLTDISSGHTEAVLSVLRARQEEIRRALLDRTNSISSSTLQDFDWQLKVIYYSILQCFLEYNVTVTEVKLSFYAWYVHLIF